MYSTICDVIHEQPLYEEQHYQHAGPHNLQCAIIPATKMQMRLQQRAEHGAVQGTLLSLCLPNPTQHNFYSRAQEKASVTQSIFTLYMNERQLSLQDVGHDGGCSTAALHAAAGGCRQETGVGIRDWVHTYCALGLGWVGWAPH